MGITVVISYVLKRRSKKKSKYCEYEDFFPMPGIYLLGFE